MPVRATEHAPARRRGERSRPRPLTARRFVGRWWVAGALAAATLVGLILFLVRPRSSTNGALATLQTGDFHALAFDPTDARVAFFGHHGGVLRTEDGGRTWRPLVERPNFDAMSLGISRADARRVYLAGHDVFQVSVDGGSTWQPVSHNLPGTDIHAFTVNPENPDRLAALVVGRGAFRSADGGRSWTPMGGGLPDDVMALASAGGEPEVLFASGARSGVFGSTDGGGTWARTAGGADPPGVTVLTIGPADPGTLYADTERGLFKASGAGAAWSKLPYPAENVVALAVSPSDPNVLLAIGVENRRGLVFRSEDGGLTWGGRR